MREKLPGPYCVIAVRYTTLNRQGLKVNLSDVHDYTLDPAPEIIGYCEVPASYVHVWARPRILFVLKGQPPRDIKDAGSGTMERLEARGFVRTAGEVKPGYVPDYEITPQGEAEWLKICDTPALKGRV